MLRFFVLAFAFVVPTSTLAQDLTVHGNFRHMMHTGETDGTVTLGRLTVPSAWGVGATAGLRGEVVIRDGAVLVSRGDDPDAALWHRAGACGAADADGADGAGAGRDPPRNAPA